MKARRTFVARSCYSCTRTKSMRFTASYLNEPLEFPLNLLFLFYFLVHRIRPADIKAIGAMGDSLTVSGSTSVQSFILLKLGGLNKNL